ncbi:signal peptidase I [Brachybacterium fresconis]|uniref:Signal peptidase I n=1 Tax=Brachybacterium fresconis TaxID=173363 RepID=A0ABS4YJR4_9MICO|nr:signal peptidase I [Brachybacterium fresconis]MBP2408989.1 signal peptidase I [Brachybacterium fresconis]
MSVRRTEPGGRGLVGRLADLALTVLAVAGAVCIVLVILSWAFNVSLMMFRTGSMSPTIPAGSVALVREIPATEMEVGDVVTVDRGTDLLPVTHRVVEIHDADASSGAVTFEMRGDANDTVDPEPYTTQQVQRVIFSVPRAARVIQWLGDPYVLGGLTIGASLLVVWAFWPRDDEESGPADADDEEPREVPPDDEQPHDEQPHDGPSEDGRSEDGPPDDDAPQDEGPAPGHDTSGRTVLRIGLLPLAAALMLGAPGPGHAESTLITGEHLRMQTEGDTEQMRNLAPGQSVVWTVGVWAEAPDPGQIRLGITGGGDLAEVDDALTVSVSGCSTPWVGDRCPSDAHELLAAEGLDSLAETEGTRALTTMPSDEERWLRVQVTLTAAASEADLSGADGRVLVHAVGAGDELSTGPDGPPDGQGPDGQGPDGQSPDGQGPDGGSSADAPDGDGSGDHARDGSTAGTPGELARTGAMAGAMIAVAAATLLLAGTVLRRRARRAGGAATRHR